MFDFVIMKIGIPCSKAWNLENKAILNIMLIYEQCTFRMRVYLWLFQLLNTNILILIKFSSFQTFFFLYIARKWISIIYIRDNCNKTDLRKTNHVHEIEKTFGLENEEKYWLYNCKIIRRCRMQIRNLHLIRCKNIFNSMQILETGGSMLLLLQFF